MKDLQGRIAAVTGAGSGIGRALAAELAGRGCHLALSDIDKAGLEETVELAERPGVLVTAQALDVADRLGMEQWSQQVVDDHGSVHLIVNNAGVALGSTVDAMSYEDFDWLMGVNFWGVVHGTKAFLPHLKAAGEGHIVNISSVFGLVGIPSQSAYNAAKFAVRGFTEALRIELDLERSGVSCTTVHPGGIKTNIARNGRFDGSVQMFGQDPSKLVEASERAFITSPQRAAKVILRAVEADKRRVMIGPDGHLLNALAHLPPGVYQRLIGLGVGLGKRLPL
ncbi:MAG: SDR family NAD(P)-dependent oxidoreductase [Acidimicrobiales bacterium]|nr:SDR family NAD(P)-dependent oxidoreductase [Acidimicrobiales bacterium]